MTGKPESGDVGARVHGVRRQLVNRVGRRAVQRAHRSHGFVGERRRRAIEFDGRSDDAGAERLGEEQNVAGARAAVGENPRGIDRSGDGVPEFDFLILHGVAAKQRDARFAQLVESAAKDFADGPGLEALFRERGDRERGQRPAAHRVDVADGVGRGDLAVDVRVVDDRREEVDGLHERRSALPREHTRIVRGPEVDEDAVVGRGWDSAQHLSELACGEFARSTGAGDHLGQTLVHRHFLTLRAGPHIFHCAWAPLQALSLAHSRSLGLKAATRLSPLAFSTARGAPPPLASLGQLFVDPD